MQPWLEVKVVYSHPANLGSVSSFTDMIQFYVTKDIQSKLFHFTPGHFNVLIGEYMKLNSVANSGGSL